MDNIFQRMSKLRGCHYVSAAKSIHLPLIGNRSVFQMSIGDDGVMLNSYGESEDVAYRSLLNRVFRGKRRSNESKMFLFRLGFNPDITVEQMDIRLTLMGL